MVFNKGNIPFNQGKTKNDTLPYVKKESYIRNGKTYFKYYQYKCISCDKFLVKAKKCRACIKKDRLIDNINIINPKKSELLMKSYAKLNYLKNMYNLSLNEFEQIIINQKNKCAICNISFDEIMPHIDHDHGNDIVRGILCRYCNSGLGFFKDDINNLKNAIRYLIDSRPRNSAFSSYNDNS